MLDCMGKMLSIGQPPSAIDLLILKPAIGYYKSVNQILTNSTVHIFDLPHLFSGELSLWSRYLPTDSMLFSVGVGAE